MKQNGLVWTSLSDDFYKRVKKHKTWVPHQTVPGGLENPVLMGEKKPSTKFITCNGKGGGLGDGLFTLYEHINRSKR